MTFVWIVDNIIVSVLAIEASPLRYSDGSPSPVFACPSSVVSLYMIYTHPSGMCLFFAEFTFHNGLRYLRGGFSTPPLFAHTIAESSARFVGRLMLILPYLS